MAEARTAEYATSWGVTGGYADLAVKGITLAPALSSSK